MIQTVEDRILSLLRAEYGERYAIEPYQKSPRNYQFAHALAALVPVFQDGGFGSSGQLDGGGRPFLPEFNLAQFTRGLHPEGKRPGAYELLEETHDVLKGQEVAVPGDHRVFSLRCQRMFFIASLPGGAWVYGQDWRLSEN